MPSVTNSKSQRSLGSRYGYDHSNEGNRKRSKNRPGKSAGGNGNGGNNTSCRPRRSRAPPSDIPDLKLGSSNKAFSDGPTAQTSCGFNVVPDDFPELTRDSTVSQEPSGCPLVQSISSAVKRIDLGPHLPSKNEKIGSELVPACSVKPESIPAERKRIQDQFGLAAFVGVLGKAKEEPDLVTLSLGIDESLLLNVDMKTPEAIHPSFGGPFSPNPVRAENLSWDVPSCYRFSENNCPVQRNSIRKKLLPPKVEELKDEVLFYLFYTFTRDALQQMASVELYKRDWRYHTEEKVWITPIPGTKCFQRSQYFERGIFYFFDPITWKKVSREFCVEYTKLESRPVPPSTSLMTQS